ncbi:acyl-CoA dehydrogenase [Mycolicibacterium novocastrense]|uniref:acyl-CoA dehydrogenase family protein n=1 Tax=Mycolicibacterium novocastrense TaxID=59813 RepID=UPI000746FBF7|nr:acyl-CoA dehydrogenase family protein [Mycolicibacterium novocastrense]KUH67187.1 acyl-CoA dehydrogenase [Mycolicibacterium novocastrense]KUH68173.1 acyl-CoA dehydrogenase [Mycolicibacterium novocastrense]KUH68655.1 acyl-CoA dehydrogenase [Mycolicibacterium novocastrense]
MLEWSDVDLAVRDAVREFVDKEIRPHVDALESGEMEPYPIVRKLFATFGIADMARESLNKRLARLRDGGGSSEKSSGGGMFGEGSGGMGFVVISELCRVSMGVVTGMGVSLGLTVPTIMSRGTLAQQERWLPDLVTYDKVGAWAITEPDSGSDAFGGMKSYVVRDGDDYILNGQKTFITNGPDADVVVVYAKLDEGDPGVDKRDRKVLTFVLDRGMEGFVQSKPFRKMGIHSSRTGELFFNNVRLGRDRLLGETEDNSAGDGRASARSSFSTERIGVAAMSLGVIEECLRLCVDYAKSRTLWGQEIAQFQLIQLKLANMEVARMNVRNILFRVIEAAQAGVAISLAEASAIKWYCSQAATDVAMDAVQLFGGNGYMTEYRVEQLARDAKSLMIYAGSNEVQITHVARGLLS